MGGLAAEIANTARVERQRIPRTEEPAGVSLDGDTVIATLPPGATIKDVEGILRARGIDPSEWIIERVTANEWEALAPESQIVTLHQLKVQLRHRSGVILPAAEVQKRHKPAKSRPPTWKRPVLAVVCGDQHAPYYDEALHETFLRWLADIKPDIGVLAGDTMDLPSVSKHRDKINWNAPPQVCIDSGYRVASDYRDAHPPTRWRKLKGNHDIRIETDQMARAERTAYIRPALRGNEPEDHLYSVRRLLHLDALEIELVGKEGEDWRYGETWLDRGLVVRHEPTTQEKTARLNRSVIAGHTHRQGMRGVTCFDDDDNPVVRTVVETGCMARTREGLGYTDHPNWAAGFATASVYPDGAHHFDLATWRDGVLTWRGERWGAGRRKAA